MWFLFKSILSALLSWLKSIGFSANYLLSAEEIQVQKVSSLQIRRIQLTLKGGTFMIFISTNDFRTQKDKDFTDFGSFLSPGTFHITSEGSKTSYVQHLHLPDFGLWRVSKFSSLKSFKTPWLCEQYTTLSGGICLYRYAYLCYFIFPNKLLLVTQTSLKSFLWVHKKLAVFRIQSLLHGSTAAFQSSSSWSGLVPHYNSDTKDLHSLLG